MKEAVEKWLFTGVCVLTLITFLMTLAVVSVVGVSVIVGHLFGG